MNSNYAVVKLLRYDESIKSNNESISSESSTSTTKVSGINQTVEVKRSSRLTRKRTFQDKHVIEDDDHLANIKKKKSNVNKPQFSKTEPEKPIVPQKDSKKPKSSILNNAKLSDNVSTNSDFNKMSDTVSSSNHVHDKMDVSIQNSSKPAQNKKIKSINPNKKNILTNVNEDDTSNEGKKKEDIVPSKILKSKLSKFSTFNKKNLSCSVNKASTSKKNVLNDNSVSLKPTKNKSSKSNNVKKSFVVKFTNKNNVSTNLQGSDHLATSKIHKSKSPTKKKPMVNNLKKNDISIEVEKKSDASVPNKRGRPLLKKGQLPNTNIDDVCNNEINSKQTTNMAIALDKLDKVQKPELSKDPNDNMMMLRSNNKPPKIKKKWSEEWSEDKLSNSILKSNNEDHLGDLKIDLNNLSKTVKKVIRTPKSKNTNYKIIKTKMLEKLDENTNDSFLIKSPNNNDHIDVLNTNTNEIQNKDNLSITSSIQYTEFKTVNNDLITEPDNNKIVTDLPSVCDDTNSMETINSSEVTTKPITCTQLSTSSIEIPTTSTQSFNNEVVFENDQSSSYLITSESIFESNSSFPMVYNECPEISYGISILSEAISRQCRESNEESNKTKTSEQDITEIQSSPKKTNSSSRSQVPSAMVSPQRLNEHKNKSKKVVKSSSRMCEPSVQTDLQSRAEREIVLLSKRFNIPIETLRKTVIEEPLSVFHKKYSESITPSMITISPIVKDVETKIKPCNNYLSGNLDVEYKVEPIREAAAYEKTNLKDLMNELSKTMPSWSLSIVTNPSRYVISHMTINSYGVPYANKVIVLDKLFRASVYINQSLEHTYSKSYTTATEIVNLIKELNSI